ncbi:hypothetical protein SPRG_14572 [Saprolegnia parasitica CBS 223.65]|uniref:Uncharacterized protein n=1 Tax=Saprolegnia parasitica (strain CBS 223.65) TaxID=695850 RepID=A0A067BZH6_SAPPC|nr:hypothetical protein SPRG_14572 [Saprolegnia parasitica CBS 223.65]KDO19992.1 hypothetical protein SPRG_14572 [Saprolegnia parasitica CBS 223.65]|eukprot:XP_012209295.1 hypothetical protein SPRG_14572 [Saprolegnia parasitica CBS 223.65]
MARGDLSKKRKPGAPTIAKPGAPTIAKPCSLPEAEYKPCFVCGHKFNVDSLMRCLVCAGFFHKRCLATITADAIGCAACQDARNAEVELQAERNDPSMYPPITGDTNKHLFEFRMTMMHKFMSAIAAHKAPPKKKVKVPTKRSATPTACAEALNQTPPFDPPAPVTHDDSMADVDMVAPAAPSIAMPLPAGPTMVALRDANVEICPERAPASSSTLPAEVVPSTPQLPALTLHVAHSEPLPAALESPRATLVSAVACSVSPVLSTLVLPKCVLEQTASAVAATPHATMPLHDVGVATEVVQETGSIMLSECVV